MAKSTKFFVGIALVLVSVLKFVLLLQFLGIIVSIAFHQDFMVPINIFQVALEELSSNRKISVLLPNLVSFISNQVSFIICFFFKIVGFSMLSGRCRKKQDIFSSVSVVDFEQVNVCWVNVLLVSLLLTLNRYLFAKFSSLTLFVSKLNAAKKLSPEFSSFFLSPWTRDLV